MEIVAIVVVGGLVWVALVWLIWRGEHPMACH
jgi:hypothetical protein